MRLTVDPDRRRVDLDKGTFLARGGEGEIHIDPDNPRTRVLKVYHQPDTRRARKLEVMMNMGAQFPPQIAAPLALVRGDQGTVVGFQMRQLNRRFVKAHELFSRQFCDAAKITTPVKAEIYLAIADQLQSIHRNRFIIGDLNDGGFLINQDDHATAWVDVDSWQIPGYPCIVGTELYLCPALYGIDLSQGTHFQEWHDWYSYSVLLFRTLLRKHPFKAGLHPVHRSVVQRAQAGVTVLDRGVSLPDDLKPEILSDDLTEALLRQLKGQVRAPFPSDVLEQYRHQLVECSSCGLWYPGMRKHCPGCAVRTMVDIARTLDLVETELVKVRGQILRVLVRGNTVVCLAEESGMLVQYTCSASAPARLDTGIRLQPSMTVALHQDTVVIADDADPDADVATLYLLDIATGVVKPVKATTTTILRGQQAVMAASGRFVYRLAQNMLLACERFGDHDLLERPVTQVFENQCWFTCDPDPHDGTEVVCGYNRDRSHTRWFVSTCSKGQNTFTTREIEIPELRRGESALDTGVYIRDGQCLIARKTRFRGIDHIRLDLVDTATNGLLHSSDRDLSAHPEWESVRGKGFAGGMVMHPTDRGIVREEVKSLKSVVLKDSTALVTPDDRLLPYAGGILRIGANRISVIVKR